MDPVKNMCKLCLPTRKNAKRGFGIVEVMVSIVVLGFMYVALSKLQGGNHDAFIRIRGRDGAVEVAQRVLDSLKTVGAASITSKANGDTTLFLGDVSLKWERGLGGFATIAYSPRVIVKPTNDYESTARSSYENISHIYAKQVEVQVDWNFKGSAQSINVSGVIR
ncbi:hypothetical protein SAMN05720766_106117 [Fibrobacter sp. UWH9]|uniref:type IV pilus modification PilV family protein n=1 Tax=unclassified Fibrobacter TaxID=2634177 RepID=UPI0009201024|nr:MULTISPECIES: type II secretion system protein [unclassified Fibrobacter]SHH05080.1 hypothetical protein SAMN05720766_106117 [Fibrobacter sp. UWH9]